MQTTIAKENLVTAVLKSDDQRPAARSVHFPNVGWGFSFVFGRAAYAIEFVDPPPPGKWRTWVFAKTENGLVNLLLLVNCQIVV